MREIKNLRPNPRDFMKNSESKIHQQAILDLSTEDQLFFGKFGQGETVHPDYECIHLAFEAQVNVQPTAIAIEHLNETMTYGELNDQANRLAQLLIEHGVSSGDSVGLFLQRSIPMVVGIFATLKIGAAYVPQHLGVATSDQLTHILKSTAAKVVLTLSHLRHLIPISTGLVCIDIDKVIATPLPKPKELTPVQANRMPVQASNTCFILFTSGTTGKPNGVEVTHANVCNIILTTPGNLGIRPGMKVSQILSIAFDLAAWEILGCLTNGGTLVIREKNIEETVKKVDVVIATPTILSSLDIHNCGNVKVVAVAGEPCPRVLADRWSDLCEFYNCCGPTETTIVNTMKRHSRGVEKMTIGRPTPNNTVYILDEQLKPCPIGQVGEMWAGGECVSNGYLNNTSLTQERYLPDPFLGGGRKMFRTRDLGRWTPEGDLEHLGRTDDQVKIRGFRVELDSVSAALESVHPCQRAVTLKLNDRDLVSFVSPGSVNIEEAKNAVKAALPYYCMPSIIIALEELPLTSNGKIDKRALTILAV
jgi:D-alanine--poly(phosphoribitol) ligase subunit 1